MMLQIKITTKQELIKALSGLNVRKIITKEALDQKALSNFIDEIKPLLATSGVLTLIAIKE